MEENGPAGNSGADNQRIPPGSDYEYDEAHDVPVGPLHETPAPRRVDPPSDVHFGEGGDYGYDEAHDFCARRSTKS
jgi:hypothetical protein